MTAELQKTQRFEYNIIPRSRDKKKDRLRGLFALRPNGCLGRFDQRLLNCFRRRALWKPTFLRSTSRASRVTNPAFDKEGFNAAS